MAVCAAGTVRPSPAASITATTGTRITAAPGRATSRVGPVYRPLSRQCSSRWAAASVPHRSSGSDQDDFPTRPGPHQIVEAIPTAMRPMAASSGNSLRTDHGAGFGPAARGPAAACPLLTRRV